MTKRTLALDHRQIDVKVEPQRLNLVERAVMATQAKNALTKMKRTAMSEKFSWTKIDPYEKGRGVRHVANALTHATYHFMHTCAKDFVTKGIIASRKGGPRAAATSWVFIFIYG